MLHYFSVIIAILLISSPSWAQSTSRYQKIENRDCEIWNPNPLPNETINWTGKCVDGKGSGKGIIAWGNVVDGKARVSVSDVTLKSGKHQGYGEHFSASGRNVKVTYDEGKRITTNDLNYGNSFEQRSRAKEEIKNADIPHGLITGIDKAILKSIVENAGMTFVKDGYISNKPAVIFKDDSGFQYVALGQACSAVCKGLNLMGEFTRDTPISFSEINTQNMKYAAASVMRYDTDPKKYTVSHYLILDHGKQPANIKINITTFVALNKKIAENLGARQEKEE